MQYSAIILTAVSTFTAVHGLGINCRGSSNCASQGNCLTTIHSNILNLNPSTPFSNGQHITCAGGTGNACAFYQNLEGSQTAAQAAQHVQNLLDHGCNCCGSDPTDGNDVNNGELTVNWVSSP